MTGRVSDDRFPDRGLLATPAGRRAAFAVADAINHSATNRPLQHFASHWNKVRILPLSMDTRTPTGRPDLTELAARKFVESHGCDALSILGERAEMAKERGHSVAAKTWRDLADVAARVLGASDIAKSAGFAATAWRTALAAALRGAHRRL